MPLQSEGAGEAEGAARLATRYSLKPYQLLDHDFPIRTALMPKCASALSLSAHKLDFIEFIGGIPVGLLILDFVRKAQPNPVAFGVESALFSR